MATTVNIPILVKGTSVAGRAPTAADLMTRQLAVNLVDRKLYTKDDSGTIIQIGTASSDFSTVAFSGSYNDLTNKPTIPPQYTLPAATATVLGGIKVAASGTGLVLGVDGSLTSAILSLKGEFGVTKTGNVILTRADLGLDILDSNNKIEAQYLPDSITGAMVYKGTYDAATNTPVIPDPDSTNLGWLYVVSVDGTFTPSSGSPIEVAKGGWLISNETEWQYVPPVNTTVISVNDQTGAVTINASNLPGLAPVGVSNDYNDLDNKPVLAAVATSGSYNDLDNKPVLAAVATSGSYNDLTNLPPNPAIANIGVNVNGNPIIEAVAYIFTDPMQFQQNFAGSKAFAIMQTGTQASVRIMQALASAPSTFTQIGTLVYNTSNNTATFTTTASGTVSFAAGDILRYEWVSSGIASISITLRGQKL